VFFLHSYFSEVSSRPSRPSRPPKPSLPWQVRSRLRELRRLWVHRDPQCTASRAALRHECKLLRKFLRKSLRLNARKVELQQLHRNIQAFRRVRYGFARSLFHLRTTVNPTFSKGTADAHFSRVLCGCGQRLCNVDAHLTWGCRYVCAALVSV
jgi:hypothetical protein